MANPRFSMDPGQAVPATKVEITVSARNLLDMDTFSKSDPMCVMFIQPMGTKNFVEFGRTEVIWDNLNPDFVTKFVLDYFFEERQELKFELYDVDSKSKDLRKHDFLGAATCALGAIVGSNGGRMILPLSGLAKNAGTIILQCEELSDCRDLVTMQFKGEKLDKKDFFGKSDPFLVFYRCNEDGSYTICHKTEVIKNTLNPNWKPFSIMVRSLCNGDYDRTIKVECYDWNSSGSHEIIGEFTTSLRQLSQGPGAGNHYECVNKVKQKKKKSYKHSGMITLLSCSVEPQHSFLDYIRGGTQLNFTVAIDFTASNGNPVQPTSLHYINPYNPNHYERALRAVGEIIQDYDTDKLFPALGFGARLPPDGRVSHEFFMNFNPTNPYCAGLEGILQAYKNSLHAVQLYGPTLFAPVVNHVARFAAARLDGTEYFVLLIVTDGCICDMAQTKAAIVGAAKLPMSIIIVGVGNEDFSAMEELDGDDVRLSSQGVYAERDIVQFVPFRDFEGERDLVMSQARLAKEVLAEIPDQFVSWMKKRGIKPKKPSYHTMQATAPSPMPSAPSPMPSAPMAPNVYR